MTTCPDQFWINFLVQIIALCHYVQSPNNTVANSTHLRDALVEITLCARRIRSFHALFEAVDKREFIQSRCTLEEPCSTRTCRVLQTY